MSYGSGNDVITHDYANYGIAGDWGAFAILGEVYYRNGGGRRDFNIDPPTSSVHRKNYGSDELGDMNHLAPMVKMLWQLPTRRNMVFEWWSPTKMSGYKMNSSHLISNLGDKDWRIF